MLEAVLDQLAALRPITLKEVGGAASYAALGDEGPPLHLCPAAYAVPLAEQPAPSRTTGLVRHIVTVHFAILLAYPGVAPSTKGAQVMGIGAIRQAIRDQLLGWCPPGGQSGIVATDSSLAGIRKGVLWWQDSFSTQVTYAQRQL
jgi:hypothetical protein